MTTSSRQWGPLLQVATVAAILFLPGSATAREDEIEPTAPAPPVAAAGKIDMAIGVAGTTDYQSRGITQSDSDPAIQGYIEPSYGLGPVLGDAIVNIWSSSDVDFGAGVQGAEIDIAAGIKPKFLGPKWSPNIGWVYYFYAPEDLNPAYGEVYAKTDYTFGEEDRSDGQIGTSSPLQIFNSESCWLVSVDGTEAGPKHKGHVLGQDKA